MASLYLVLCMRIVYRRYREGGEGFEVSRSGGRADLLESKEESGVSHAGVTLLLVLHLC